jgi:7-hydroxymethyl chlorophyll a reductase
MAPFLGFPDGAGGVCPLRLDFLLGWANWRNLVKCVVSETLTMATLHPQWRDRSRPIAPDRPYPAGAYCSQCGLCDSYYVAHVGEACGFLGAGMSQVERMEPQVHGRDRREDERHFGVTQRLAYGRVQQPVPGAQWTGLVTTIAQTLLRRGMVQGVVCVQSDPGDPFTPRPVLATTEAEVLAARGVKPTLSPNLRILEDIERQGLQRILFIGVGCQVQALRAVAGHLNLEQLYVLGTHCVDNGRRSGLDRFLQAASHSPATVQHYEFMQDYRVHLKHRDGHFERVPYFSLPAGELAQQPDPRRDSPSVIAPSCYSCFDYMNGLADVVVGYMGVPYQYRPMTEHDQQVLVRNDRGQEMLEAVGEAITLKAPTSRGDRRSFVRQTLLQEQRSQQADRPPTPLPRPLGQVLAQALTWFGPQGLEFARYSIDYHTLRNYQFVAQHRGAKGLAQVPNYAQAIVADYPDLCPPA